MPKKTSSRNNQELENHWFKHPVNLRAMPQLVELVQGKNKNKKLFADFYIILELFFDRPHSKNSKVLKIHSAKLRQELGLTQASLIKNLQKLERFTLIFYEIDNFLVSLRLAKSMELLIFDNTEREERIEYNRGEENKEERQDRSYSSSSFPPPPDHTSQEITELWDESYLKLYSEEFLRKYWHSAKEFYIKSKMKKPFKAFMLDSFSRTKEKFGDPNFRPNGGRLTEAELEVARLGDELFKNARSIE
jgi:hypothetical protein